MKVHDFQYAFTLTFLIKNPVPIKKECVLRPIVRKNIVYVFWNLLGTEILGKVSKARDGHFMSTNLKLSGGEKVSVFVFFIENLATTCEARLVISQSATILTAIKLRYSCLWVKKAVTKIWGQ